MSKMSWTAVCSACALLGAGCLSSGGGGWAGHDAGDSGNAPGGYAGGAGNGTAGGAIGGSGGGGTSGSAGAAGAGTSGSAGAAGAGSSGGAGAAGAGSSGGAGSGGSGGTGGIGIGGGGGTVGASGFGGVGGIEAGPTNPFARGGELHLNTYEPGDQKEPRLAVAGDGSFVAIWMSEGQAAAGTSEVWGQRFDPSGAKLGAEFQISSTKANTTYYSASLYDVAMARDGRFVVVWSGYGSTDRVLYAQLFDAAGAKAGDVSVVDDTTDQWVEYKASVAMADDGSFAVLFDWGLNFTVGLKARSYDATGMPLDAPFWITKLRAAYEIDLAVSRRGAGAGRYAAVYRYFDIDTEIYGQAFNAEGLLLGAEFHVNTTIQGAQTKPSVDVADDGSAIVVWQSNHTGQGPSSGVFAQRYDATGAAVGGEITLSPAATGSMGTAGVVVGADGTFLATWSGDGGPTPGDWSEVWGRYFDAAGAPAGAAFRINTFTTFKQEQARIAGTANGTAAVAWLDFRQEVTLAGGDATRKGGVYGQRIAR